MPDEKTNYVHRGFLGHKQRLDERMKKAPMAPLKDSLKLWGIETSAESWILVHLRLVGCEVDEGVDWGWLRG